MPCGLLVDGRDCCGGYALGVGELDEEIGRVVGGSKRDFAEAVAVLIGPGTYALLDEHWLVGDELRDDYDIELDVVNGDDEGEVGHGSSLFRFELGMRQMPYTG